MHNHTIKNIESRTLGWVERVVVGLNLCPFAKAVVKSNDVRVHTELSQDMSAILQTLVAQCDVVQEASEQSTVLLVLPNGFDQFDDYLDLVDLSHALLEDLNLDGILQLATFHPHYQFSDSEYDDAANFTNRSPYPMLHILQEAAVAVAIEKHPDTDAIPPRNIDLLRGMTKDQLSLLVNDENNQDEQ